MARGLQRREVSLERARVNVVPVTGRMLPGAVAHLRIRTFQQDTDDALGAEFERLREAAGGHLHGLLLDLRDNPGGLLTQGVAVADRFLSGGEIVRTDGRAHARRYLATPTATSTESLPLVVLVNQGTASAAEIVAGALRAHGRAKLVGARTFGKGTVQQMYDLENGSALKLTVARYRLPAPGAQTDVPPLMPDGKGLTPDLLVATPERSWPATMDAAVRTIDPVVAAAIGVLP